VLCLQVGECELRRGLSPGEQGITVEEADRKPGNGGGVWLPVCVFPVVQFGEAGQAVAVDLVFGGGGDDAAGGGAQGGGPAAALQQGAFPGDRAGAEFADLGTVDPDAEHPVEQQVDIVARLTLLGEQFVGGEFAMAGLAPPRMLVADSCRSRRRDPSGGQRGAVRPLTWRSKQASPGERAGRPPIRRAASA
jgi:hypothetical protein